MAEGSRGCGDRKIGGMYFVGSGLSSPCIKMPANVESCPCCGGGIRQSRGFTWINPKQLFGGDCARSGIVSVIPEWCNVSRCPFDEEKAGLMWVGDRFYTPDTFKDEAVRMGVSKRIGQIPRGFELGKTWILLAHKKAGKKIVWAEPTEGQVRPLTDDMVRETEYSIEYGHEESCPAVFYGFQPVAIELTVTQKMIDEMDGAQKERHEKAGITYYIVPEGDKRYQGTVYDKQDDEEGDDE